MAGSPQKRARREAERAQAAQRQEPGAHTPATEPPERAAPLPATIPVVHGEILQATPEITRSALKRAMRAKAQEHADAAIAVLAAATQSTDERIRVAAANDLLAWGFGKPATEIEAGDGAQSITIIRFGDQT